VITLAVPQFTSGLRPTSLLNPIVDSVNASQRFFQIAAIARHLFGGRAVQGGERTILSTAVAEPVWLENRRRMGMSGERSRR